MQVPHATRTENLAKTVVDELRKLTGELERSTDLLLRAFGHGAVPPQNVLALIDLCRGGGRPELAQRLQRALHGVD